MMAILMIMTVARQHVWLKVVTKHVTVQVGAYPEQMDYAQQYVVTASKLVHNNVMMEI